MLKHYLTLGLDLDTTDEEVRRKYLNLVKTYTPENDPVMFRQITEAYEALKDVRSRVKSRLFASQKATDFEEELYSLINLTTLKRKRVGLQKLMAMLNKP